MTGTDPGAQRTERNAEIVANLEPLRDRLLSLRRQTLSSLASRPEDESLDAGLMAIVANVQTVLVAVEETMRADGLRAWQMASLSDIGDTSTGKGSKPLTETLAGGVPGDPPNDRTQPSNEDRPNG